jgi:ketosteroid isomerase-like protein
MATTEAFADIEKLTAIEEIKALSARYALGLDQFDMDLLLSPYTEDVVFDATAFELGTFTGRDELRGFFEHNSVVMKEQMHLFSNFLVELDGPDEAHGTNYLYQDGFTKEGARITCFCLNRDRDRRDEGGWRIAARTIEPLVMPSLEGYAD